MSLIEAHIKTARLIIKNEGCDEIACDIYCPMHAQCSIRHVGFMERHVIDAKQFLAKHDPNALEYLL